MTPLGFDRALVLGDLVGYGADPNAVVDRVRVAQSAAAIIRGNHDKVAAGLDDGESFNLVARSAVQWTYDALTPENLDYLRDAAGRARPPSTTTCEICHGSPFDEDAYIFDELDALQGVRGGRRGRSASSATRTWRSRFVASPIDSSCRQGPATPIRSAFRSTLARGYLVNVGSVGQPRDNDSARRRGHRRHGRRASSSSIACGIPIEEAQRKIRMAGLPEILARRLALGR